MKRSNGSGTHIAAVHGDVVGSCAQIPVLQDDVQGSRFVQEPHGAGNPAAYKAEEHHNDYHLEPTLIQAPAWRYRDRWRPDVLSLLRRLRHPAPTMRWPGGYLTFFEDPDGVKFRISARIGFNGRAKTRRRRFQSPGEAANSSPARKFRNSSRGETDRNLQFTEMGAPRRGRDADRSDTRECASADTTAVADDAAH